jgi:transposase-like protein
VPKSSLSQSKNRGGWSEAAARAVLSRLASSGLNVHAFARREGIDEQRLYRWRRKLSMLVPASVAARAPRLAPFIEVPRAASTVEVVLLSGVVLRVAENISGNALRRLVDVLSADLTGANGSC